MRKSNIRNSRNLKITVIFWSHLVCQPNSILPINQKKSGNIALYLNPMCMKGLISTLLKKYEPIVPSKFIGSLWTVFMAVKIQHKKFAGIVYLFSWWRNTRISYYTRVFFYAEKTYQKKHHLRPYVVKLTVLRENLMPNHHQ